jgi:hypothetical protein
VAGLELSFDRITNNANVNIAAQLGGTLEAAEAGFVSFTFANDVGSASSITGVYFDDAAGLLNTASNFTVLGSNGVNFTALSGSPANLPGGATVVPPFSANWYATATSPGPKNGLNQAADRLTITFALTAGRLYTDVASALTTNALRIGFHVQNIALEGGGTASDSFVSRVVPAPAAAILGAVGLSALGLLRRRLSV